MVGVGSWELVVETGVMTYSGGFARLLGLSPGEAMNGELLLKLVHAEDRRTVTQAIADCLQTGSSTCEYRLIPRHGAAVRTVSAHGELVPGGDGREAYMRGTVLDVTDTRVAERERLEAVTLFQQGFDAAPIGMVLTDPLQGRYVTTIAEGVEDEATLVRLRDLGVHLGQGYLFGRPEPLAEHPATTPGARRRQRIQIRSALSAGRSKRSRSVTLPRRLSCAIRRSSFARIRTQRSSPDAASYTAATLNCSPTPTTWLLSGRR